MTSGLRSLPRSGPDLGELSRSICELRERLLRVDELEAELLSSFDPDQRPSVRNLLHYLCLRRHDIRQLQVDLASVGLSSLGRSEGHVLSTILAIAGWLSGERSADVSAIDLHEGHAVLKKNTEALFGPRRPNRNVRIMVTMPGEAYRDYQLVHDLVMNGMDVMRINCAHDGPAEWQGMIDKLRRAEREIGRPCRILMDLGGPKLRTGPIAPGEGIVRWRPDRDEFGRVTAPARIWLTASENPGVPPVPGVAVIPVPAAFLADLSSADVVHFEDARGKPRRLEIVGPGEGGFWVSCSKSAYVTEKTTLEAEGREGAVGPLPARNRPLIVRPGDRLVVTRDPLPGR
ncbi:MAG TPA: pyruvate kinase, partial [Candidatus Sulfotelmatobacter sp.]|nr:pyruvate kinase [Candidatus Sulfotelmatobacter sp.]